MTRDVIGPGLPPAEIDRAVRELTEQGRAIYELDEEALRRAQPDLIVTQALCAVCAVSFDDVKAVAAAAGPGARGDLAGPAHARRGARRRPHARARPTDARDAGVDLVQDAAARIDRVRLAVRAAEPVRVAALEWLDPIYVAGHWTPQLIEYAGGLDVLGLPGEHSERRTLGGGRAARPEVVVVMPCGYDAERAAEEAYDVRRRARRARRPRASSRSTPPRTSPAPARAWSTGSSCSPTCCTRTGCPRRRAGSSRSRSRPANFAVV